MTAHASNLPSPLIFPDTFVDVAALVPGILVDLRYATTNNFVGARIDGYEAPRALLTRPAAQALAQVAADVARDGLVLKLFDCYRPARAVAHFARWAADADDQHTKSDYYPEHRKDELFDLGYLAARSSHSRGSTTDLTLADAATGQEVDMGTAFDLFSTRSWLSSTDVTPQQRANRQRLADAMEQAGFAPFFMEWWHFTLRDEPFPDTYFDIPIT